MLVQKEREYAEQVMRLLEDLSAKSAAIFELKKLEKIENKMLFIIVITIFRKLKRDLKSEKILLD